MAASSQTPTLAAYAAAPTPVDDRNSRITVKSCFLAVLISIVLIEIIVGRTNLMWRIVPETDVGILLNMEDQIIQANPNPKVLVFGSSRGRGAFLPTVMEKEMGLRRGEVLSLAMGGAHIQNALLTYERNRNILSRARIAIVQLDSSGFNTGIIPQGRYHQFASWEDRMAYSGKVRARLLADYVFRMDNALPAVGMYVREWIQHRKPPRQYQLDKFGRLAVVPIADDHEDKEFTPDCYQWWLNILYVDYNYSAVMEGQLVRLVRMFREDGVQVYIVHMPVVPTFQPWIDKVPGDPDVRYKALLARLSRDYGVHVGWWGAPEEAGLTARNFRDWGHLNTPGAHKWSEYFVRWLRLPEESRASLLSPINR